MEALVYLGPLTSAFLALGAFVFEWDMLTTKVSAWQAILGTQP